MPFCLYEQAINPRLRGKPGFSSRAIGSTPWSAAASYEAKSQGIHSDAYQRGLSPVPRSRFIAADQSKYIWTSEQIYRCSKVGRELVYASIDEFQVDVNEHRTALTLAQEIQEQIHSRFNITASIGISQKLAPGKIGLQAPISLTHCRPLRR